MFLERVPIRKKFESFRINGYDAFLDGEPDRSITSNRSSPFAPSPQTILPNVMYARHNQQGSYVDIARQLLPHQIFSTGDASMLLSTKLACGTADCASLISVVCGFVRAFNANSCYTPACQETSASRSIVETLAGAKANHPKGWDAKPRDPCRDEVRSRVSLAATRCMTIA